MPELLDTLQEYQQVTRVLRAFEAGGRIMSITVATIPDPDSDDIVPATIVGSIATGDMDYPQQMVEAIKTHLMEKQKRIAEELEADGVIVPVDLLR